MLFPSHHPSSNLLRFLGQELPFTLVSSWADTWVYVQKSCNMDGYSVNEGGLVRNKAVQADFDIVGGTF